MTRNTLTQTAAAEAESNPADDREALVDLFFEQSWNLPPGHGAATRTAGALADLILSSDWLRGKLADAWDQGWATRDQAAPTSLPRNPYRR